MFDVVLTNQGHEAANCPHEANHRREMHDVLPQFFLESQQPTQDKHPANCRRDERLVGLGFFRFLARDIPRLHPRPVEAPQMIVGQAIIADSPGVLRCRGWQSSYSTRAGSL